MGSISLFPQAGSSSLLGLKEERIYLSFQPTSLNHLIQQVDDLPFCVPPSLSPRRASTTRWYRNINLFSITYAFRPRLRDRLTLRRLTLPRKPWTFGVPVSHRHYRYSCLHKLFQNLQMSLRSSFTGDWNAPLPPHQRRNVDEIRSFGIVLEPRYIFGADSLDQ